MNYHAHLYFTPEFLPRARQIDERFQTWLRGRRSPALRTKLFDRVVGPHATPMLEIDFGGAEYDEVVAWIEANREGCSVLIHEDTGDDPRDHRDGIRWLGRPLPIRFEFFNEIVSDPSLRVHPAS